MSAEAILAEVLEIIPDEDHWWRGDEHRMMHEQECIVTAVNKAAAVNSTGDVTDALFLIAEEAGCSLADLARWNDAASTSFEDFRLCVKRALHRAANQ